MTMVNVLADAEYTQGQAIFMPAAVCAELRTVRVVPRYVAPTFVNVMVYLPVEAHTTEATPLPLTNVAFAAPVPTKFA